MSPSQGYGSEAGASQIGSGVVSGVALYSIVKELVETAKTRPENGFRVVPERDPGVTQGSRADPGGPPYFAGESACATETGAVFSGVRHAVSSGAPC